MGRKQLKEKVLNVIDSVTCFKYILKKLNLRDADQLKSRIRTIYINNEQPKGYLDTNEIALEYKSNAIKTSKYSLLTFIPKNLFEQFRRITNLFFLVTNLVKLFLPDPPTNPYLSLIPIGLLLLATAVKQGYEDILRHKFDNEINSQSIRILRNGHFKSSKWKDIKCGDIVEVKCESQVPCDLVLLYTEAADGLCYTTTANLDGETNLKRRSIPDNIPQFKTEKEFSNLRGIVKCDKPNMRLDEFTGKILLDEREFPVLNENVLLRGSTLKISPVVYGCAIYTGQETKMMLNSKFKSNKFSCIEKKLNIYTVFFLLVLTLLTFTSFGVSLRYNSLYTNHWYLGGEERSLYNSNINLSNFILLITIVNTLNFLIPLPTYITIELQRFLGSKFIEWDIEMYDANQDQPAKANTSDLNEDLGQIEYLFSDKTGTLTENEMEFKQFCIDGIIFEEKDGEIYQLESSVCTNLLEVNHFMS